MVGDQITIFVSFPETDKANKRKFKDFDQKLKELSPEIYYRSGKESGTLRLFRMTDLEDINGSQDCAEEEITLERIR